MFTASGLFCQIILQNAFILLLVELLCFVCALWFLRLFLFTWISAGYLKL